ncbi:helix-turn-helix domain-containing protein [Staphylococcus pseudintermedius]|uniref:helix-turn-helix domain-containing protein n=1 Tax=Staphylococcus pseudintermedius TaxID=283734 RepID=UPI0019F993DE|nr:helix-turn-helix transcriptional regulator [Staphylococcus pseudintermedius]EGQ3180723.1 helix-turn-helix transcriptional regulator [Staphylococcus pseudintermedius]
MKIGRKIRQLRNSKDMTQEELGLQLYVSVQTINKWENDKCLPDVDNLLSIARFFDISLDEFFGINISDKVENPKNYLFSNFIKKLFFKMIGFLKRV